MRSSRCPFNPRPFLKFGSILLCLLLLEKLIILASFSHLIGDDILKTEEEKGFLRLVGWRSLPKLKVIYFKEQLAKLKPKVNLEPLKDSLAFVSTIKFHFNNDYIGYCDL